MAFFDLFKFICLFSLCLSFCLYFLLKIGLLNFYALVWLQALLVFVILSFMSSPPSFVKKLIVENTRYVLGFYLYSLGNFILSFFIVEDSGIFFSLREVCCMVAFYLHSKYSPLFLDFSKEAQEIEALVQKNNPILKLEFPLFLCTVGCYLFFLHEDNLHYYEGLTPYVISLYMGFLLIRSFSVYCYLTDLSVSDHFNLRKTVKLYGFRSFGTLKTVGHICRICIKGGFLVGIGCETYPKFVFGDIDKRGVISNFLSLHSKYRITAETNSEMRSATNLLSRYPEDRAAILDDDGIIVNPVKLEKQLKARDLIIKPFFNVMVDHDHKFPILGRKK